MSQAFRDKWLRLSAGYRLTAILTYLAKTQGDIRIPEEALEQLNLDEGCAHFFTEGNYIVRYTPPSTSHFTLGSNVAVERNPEVWPMMSNETPNRLTEVMNPPTNGMMTTIDDQAAASREQAMNKAQQSAERARVMRGQPLPVRHPQHQPPIPTDSNSQ